MHGDVRGITRRPCGARNSPEQPGQASSVWITNLIEEGNAKRVGLQLDEVANIPKHIGRLDAFLLQRKQEARGEFSVFIDLV